MGLRDVLNGMVNGPGGQRPPSTGGKAKGVPRIIWALLGLLAYKAFKGDDGRAVPPDSDAQNSNPPPRRKEDAAHLMFEFKLRSIGVASGDFGL
jgi:hypothetical protein